MGDDDSRDKVWKGQTEVNQRRAKWVKGSSVYVDDGGMVIRGLDDGKRKGKGKKVGGRGRERMGLGLSGGEGE